MSATLSAGVNSLILRLDTPYDTIRTDDIRDDLIKVKVWCSSTQNFTPVDTGNVGSNQVFDGLSLSIVIPRLADGSPIVAGTPYYVKYAFISDIDEGVYTISSQLTATPISATAQIVDISGFTSFVKSDETTFTPANATLTAITAGITNPVYAWTIIGATPTTATTSSVTITPNASNGTGVTVTLSVTGTGLTTAIVKTVTIPITYVPPTYYISNYGAVFRRDLDGVVYPTAGIVLDSGYSKFRSSPAPTFIWKKNNEVISGATNYSYTVPASDYTNSTSNVYTSIVTGKDLGGNDAMISASVQIPRVDDGPIGPSTPSFTISNYGSVFRKDLDGVIYPSTGVSLETTIAAFKSTPAVTYQWKKDGVNIGGATSNTYTVPASDYTTVSTHTYSCTATGQTTKGEPVSLTASVSLPRIDDGAKGEIGPSTPAFTISNYGAVFRKDTSGTIYPSAGISLETTASAFKSSPAVTYQWKKNDVNISGATSSNYTVPVSDYTSSTSNKYSCTATGQNALGVAAVLTASVILPRIDDGIGNTGPRTATGYLYYNTAQATAPTKPATPTGYNFTTGQFTGLDANWSTAVNTATPVAGTKVWAISYAVLEASYQSVSAPSITISDPFTFQNFTGLVTFTNMNSAFGTNVTTVDGGKITTNSISADKLTASYIQVGNAASDINNGVTTISGGKITTNSISADKLTTSFIQVGSAASDINSNTTTINGGKITTGSISTDKLAANFIQVGNAASDINNGVTTISGGKITANSISADKLTTSFIQVGNAASDINNNATTINGGKITTGSIDANRLTIGATTGLDRIRLYDNKIEVWSNNGSGTSVRRVVLGDLS